MNLIHTIDLQMGRKDALPDKASLKRSINFPPGSKLGKLVCDGKKTQDL